MIEIHKGDYGFYFRFYIKNTDVTAYTIVFDVWNPNTIILDGVTCSSSLDGKHTIALWKVPKGAFDVTEGTYKGQLRILGDNYEESTEVFPVIVEE